MLEQKTGPVFQGILQRCEQQRCVEMQSSTTTERVDVLLERQQPCLPTLEPRMKFVTRIGW